MPAERRIVWDEPKRLANLARHGLDFEAFESHFHWEQFVVLSAGPSRTGRPRQRLVGRLDGLLVAAIVSPLGREALSLLSLRPAGVAERRAYGEPAED